MKKRKNINKSHNINQKSFYFEDYFETNRKNKISKKNNFFQDRIYLLFFLFFSLIFIFSLRIISVSLNEVKIFNQENLPKKFSLQRRDIVDRNDEILSRNIKTYHAAIRPSLIKDKDKFLINIKLHFPNISQEFLKKKLSDNKYFYLKKRLKKK